MALEKIKKAKITSQIEEYQDKVRQKLSKYAENEESWHYLEVVITLFSITFFIIFAIRPAAVTISGLVGEINEKEELSKRMQQKINSVIAAQEEFAQVQGKRDLLESYLPSDFAISQGLAQVVGAASKSNLSNVRISVGRVDNMVYPSRDLSKLKFNFSTAADYEELKVFLNQLGRARRWLDINNYQIGIKEEEASPGELNLHLTGGFYYWFEETYD